jgi:hypothetical protein
MPLIPNCPSPEGQALGRELVRFVEVEIAALQAAGRPIPERCGTCALRRDTSPNGCLATVADVLKCLMEHDVFNCHEADRPCGGWAILRGATPKDSGPVEMPWGYSEGA